MALSVKTLGPDGVHCISLDVFSVKDSLSVGLRELVVDLGRYGIGEASALLKQISRSVRNGVCICADKRSQTVCRHCKAQLLRLHSHPACKRGGIKLEKHAHVRKVIYNIVFTLHINISLGVSNNRLIAPCNKFVSVFYEPVNVESSEIKLNKYIFCTVDCCSVELRGIENIVVYKNLRSREEFKLYIASFKLGFKLVKPPVTQLNKLVNLFGVDKMRCYY